MWTGLLALLTFALGAYSGFVEEYARGAYFVALCIAILVVDMWEPKPKGSA